MNLNLNIAAATVQAGGTRVAAGKSRALPSASESASPAAASNSETLEISGRQAQALDVSQGTTQPTIIADEAAANDTVDFIKNAIIALPALVLRSQANLAQHSAGALLQ